MLNYCVCFFVYSWNKRRSFCVHLLKKSATTKQMLKIQIAKKRNEIQFFTSAFHLKLIHCLIVRVCEKLLKSKWQIKWHQHFVDGKKYYLYTITKKYKNNHINNNLFIVLFNVRLRADNFISEKQEERKQGRLQSDS